MSQPSALPIVQELYAAFGRGDLPALLARLHPEVEWAANVDRSLPGSGNVPCYEPGRGRAFVGGYFQKFAAGYELHVFDILSFMAGGNEVTVRLLVDVTIRRTGKRIRSEVFHHWTLNAQGEVTRFLDVEDTLGFTHAWN